jgi:hypothetical protein
MKRKNKRSKRRKEVIRVWTYPQAQKALPYIGSVMRSLREHWLEAQQHDARAMKIDRQPGRPDRQAILDREMAAEESRRAKDRFNEAYHELQQIEVYCLDPNQGVGVIPFVHDDKLAWLIYDLFDGEPLQHWRYHDDPLDLRRPISDALNEGPGTKSLAV